MADTSGTTLPQQPASPSAPQPVGIKETVTSLIIAFALAFVFRGFVVEPYVIPTGSMAPTLLGAHMRFTNPSSGHDWAVNHWFHAPAGTRDDNPVPLPQQGGVLGGTNMGPVTVVDPLTKEEVTFTSGVPLRSGDRIFVLRYLWPIFKPGRYDVVVFKWPGKSEVSFIKRMVGKPNEQIALFDGDVFVRTLEGENRPAEGTNTWLLDGWKTAPKPEREQRVLWWTLFDSSVIPSKSPAGKPFAGPFVSADPGWEIAGRQSYAYSGGTPTRLRWDTTADKALDYRQFFMDHNTARAARDKVRRGWHLVDTYPFDEMFQSTGLTLPGDAYNSGQVLFYPISDLRLSAGVQPEKPGMTFSAVIRARGHEFRGRLVPSGDGYKAVVEMRPIVDGQSPEAGWEAKGDGMLAGVMEPGEVTNVEFWHADQTLQLWVNNRPAASGKYEWSLAERVRHTMGMTLEEVLARDEAERNANRPPTFAVGGNYSKPEPWFELSGAATLHRVRVDRDIYYQPVRPQATSGGLAMDFCNASYPADRYNIFLGPDQYFVCGDNSPNSADGRYWTTVSDPWVAQIDPTPGVVNERLLVGKAFLVYFPAVQSRELFGAKIPMIDAGRVRWIW